MRGRSAALDTTRTKQKTESGDNAGLGDICRQGLRRVKVFCHQHVAEEISNHRSRPTSCGHVVKQTRGSCGTDGQLVLSPRGAARRCMHQGQPMRAVKRHHPQQAPRFDSVGRQQRGGIGPKCSCDGSLPPFSDREARCKGGRHRHRIGQLPPQRLQQRVRRSGRRAGLAATRALLLSRSPTARGSDSCPERVTSSDGRVIARSHGGERAHMLTLGGIGGCRHLLRLSTPRRAGNYRLFCFTRCRLRLAQFGSGLGLTRPQPLNGRSQLLSFTTLALKRSGQRRNFPVRPGMVLASLRHCPLVGATLTLNLHSRGPRSVFSSTGISKGRPQRTCLRLCCVQRRTERFGLTDRTGGRRHLRLAIKLVTQ